MASDVKNVYAAEPLASGSVLVAPLGTDLPTSTDDELDPEFVDLGYVGEDGFTETMERTTDEKKAFGGDTVKVLQTEYNHSFQFVLLESVNAEVLKAVYGADNVTVTPASSTHGTQVAVKKNARKLPHMSWVIDTTDSESGAKYRNVIPDGQITEVGDVTIVHSDTISYEVTVKCFKNSAGDYVYTYSDDGQVVGS
ncbi:tail assembly chaperone [Mycobacterium phage Gaia]|uniref:Tail assembly chaperone n=1 Tax=Mycobacterium phage Gaia TaxID=1486472 RepID=A0A068F8K4_9CAUD|nr:major tail protein [Mycobacterium phage Gaia]AID58830.1 tail assembly chaperone [Mycobacterium phage Gaia]AYQ99952.1 major tail protein [Mycobacterium phage Nebkiss]